MKRFEFEIARRMSLTSDKSERRSSPAIKVAVAAVALSLTVIIVATAVVLGFKQQIREKVVGFNSHITIYPIASADDNATDALNYTPALQAAIKNNHFVTDCQLMVSAPALLKTSEAFKGVYLRGVDKGFSSDFLKSNVEKGDVPDFSSAAAKGQILISRRAADELQLNVGDSINTYFVGDGLRARRLKVSGIYNSHFDTYDDLFAYVPLSTVQELTSLLPSQGSLIEITVDDPNQILQYADSLQVSLNDGLASGKLHQYFGIDTVYRQGGNFFAWLDLLDTNVLVILVLMTIVSAFTLIAGMLIIILEKVRFIGVMKALGSSSASLRAIFRYMAMRVGIRGMVIGNIVAFLIVGVQMLWHIIPLNPDAYYMDYVPVAINPWAIALIEVSYALVIYLVLILPSRFISRISPSIAMRFDE